MKRTILLTLTMMILSTLTAVAQRPTGVLTGHVLDKTGRPVIGATIRILGTTQGGVSKAPDGKFMVQNILIGAYRVRITAIGYKPVEYEVRIEADRTASITAQFTEAIALIGDLPVGPLPLVRRERFGTTSTITAEDLDRMP